MNVNDNSCDINSLILRVRNKDQEAFDILLEKYKPLLYSLVSKFTCDDLLKPHEEDLLQEATIVFYNAILAYDETQNQVEFGLYAHICLSNALISQVRNLNRRKVEHSAELSGSEIASSVYSDPADNILEEESIRQIYSVIKSNLSQYEYSIWSDYMRGKTAKDIGTSLGKSEKSVTNAIYRIRRKLRALLK